MATGEYFLAFDFGTESVRGAVFDAEGRMLCSESEQYTTYFPRQGWAEQEPDAWWEAFLAVLKRIIDTKKVPAERIAALAVDTTSCTVLALDKNFKPLRNALLWMDVRSAEQAQRIAETGMGPLRYNGFGSVSAEWMPCKALWIKENEPDLWKDARYICEFQDWINYKISGRFVGSINNATVRWYYNNREGGWPTDFYAGIGLEDVIDKFPPEILELGKPIGKVSGKLADETGLSRETILVQSGADAYIGILGLGAVGPGRLAFITGSSHLMLGHTDEGFYKEGIFGAFPDGVVPGLYVVEGAQISSGSVLKWFKEGFVGSSLEDEARRAGLSLYDYLSREAAKIRIGSEGLVLLNYWQGNRNPLVDSLARGAVWGLTLKHTPVHVYRAVMEGVSYGSEHIMRYFREAGFVPKEIYACGGATKSDLWMQIQCDVLGVPIFLTEEPNAPLLGDAMLASIGCGTFGSMEEAAERMVKVKKKIEPDLEKTKEYRYYVDKYIETYPLLKDLMHEVVRHEMALP